MCDKSKTVAFSGHRSHKSAAADLFSGGRSQEPGAVRERLDQTLRTLAEEGCTDFLCGMAEGFDMLAGEAVVALRREFPHVRLVAVVPFPQQGRGFAAGLRERYDDLLAAADRVVIVSPCYTPECFHLRNDYLVDHSSTLVCHYNGSGGGTQYTVRRALRSGLRVVNLI